MCIILKQKVTKMVNIGTECCVNSIDSETSGYNCSTQLCRLRFCFCGRILSADNMELLSTAVWIISVACGDLNLI